MLKKDRRVGAEVSRECHNNMRLYSLLKNKHSYYAGEEKNEQTEDKKQKKAECVDLCSFGSDAVII